MNLWDVIIAITFSAVLAVVGRWIYKGGVETGEARAVSRINRRFNEHVDGFADWYAEAHDLERIKFRNSEVAAYKQAFRMAQKLVNQRRID